MIRFTEFSMNRKKPDFYQKILLGCSGGKCIYPICDAFGVLKDKLILGNLSKGNICISITTMIMKY